MIKLLNTCLQYMRQKQAAGGSIMDSYLSADDKENMNRLVPGSYPGITRPVDNNLSGNGVRLNWLNPNSQNFALPEGFNDTPLTPKQWNSLVAEDNASRGIVPNRTQPNRPVQRSVAPIRNQAFPNLDPATGRLISSLPPVQPQSAPIQGPQAPTNMTSPSAMFATNPGATTPRAQNNVNPARPANTAPMQPQTPRHTTIGTKSPFFSYAGGAYKFNIPKGSDPRDLTAAVKAEMTLLNNKWNSLTPEQKQRNSQSYTNRMLALKNGWNQSGVGAAMPQWNGMFARTGSENIQRAIRNGQFGGSQQVAQITNPKNPVLGQNKTVNNNDYWLKGPGETTPTAPSNPVKPNMPNSIGASGNQTGFRPRALPGTVASRNSF